MGTEAEIHLDFKESFEESNRILTERASQQENMRVDRPTWQFLYPLDLRM